MSQLLSPSLAARKPRGASTILMRTTGRFRRAAVAALCALAAAGWGCGSGPEVGGATPSDAGAPPARAASGRRVALVVGNDAYTGQSQLYNAVNDARAVAAALGEESVGFSVTTLEDATRAELTSALASFTRSLREDDVALFYFAGHGVQVDGVNYLLPVDHAGQTEEAVRLDALSAASVEEMLRPARVAMLVFDACRNNPYRGVRGGTGLAPMEARGTLIAYAAGAGEVAADAAAPGVANGLFTSKFVEALEEPGLTASALFMRVRQEVVSASNEEQWPAVYNDLLSDFVFRGAASAGVAPSTGGSPPVASDGVLSPVRAQQETVFWQSIQDSADAPDFEAYLELFPTGTFAPLARNRLAALRAPAAPRPGPAAARPGAPAVAIAASDAPGPAAALSPAAAAEAALGLDREARRRIQRGLAEAGFDPGPADGMFGSETRTAIRGWQASRGAAVTGYLDGRSAAALSPLPPPAVSPPARRPVASAVSPPSARRPVAPAVSPSPTPPPFPPAVDPSRAREPMVFMLGHEPDDIREFTRECPGVRVAQNLSQANALFVRHTGSIVEIRDAEGQWIGWTEYAGNRFVCSEIETARDGLIRATVGQGTRTERAARPVVFMGLSPDSPYEGFKRDEREAFANECSRVQVSLDLRQADYILLAYGAGARNWSSLFDLRRGNRVRGFSTFRRGNLFDDMCEYFPQR